MNIRDYIKAKLSIWSVTIPDALIDIELQKVGVDPEEEATSEINTIDFFYNIIPEILAMPNNVSEGGFSISYDKEALVKYYKLMAQKLGKRDFIEANTITDISNKW